MTNKIVYGIVFSLAFILTTTTIVLLNNYYKNIFKFDFTTVNNKTAGVLADKNVIEAIRKKITEEVRRELLDSLNADRRAAFARVDTMQNTVNAQDVEQIKAKIEELSEMNRRYEEERVVEAQELSVSADEEEFNNWVKTTAKLFDSMDSKKAAKIIIKYSDNESREIIYRMKKKKAAEILAQLNPEDAKKITEPL